MVNAELCFVAILSLALRCNHDASIVYQNIKLLLSFTDTPSIIIIIAMTMFMVLSS